MPLARHRWPGWGGGMFVKELEDALLRCEVDLAVHRLKGLAEPQKRTPKNRLGHARGVSPSLSQG